MKQKLEKIREWKKLKREFDGRSISEMWGVSAPYGHGLIFYIKLHPFSSQ